MVDPRAHFSLLLPHHLQGLKQGGAMAMINSQLQMHRAAGWEVSPSSSPLLMAASFKGVGGGSRDFLSGQLLLSEQPSIGQVGGMVPLVKLLGATYEDSVIALSASAIAGLAIHATNADAFREAGGVPSLVWLLKVHPSLLPPCPFLSFLLRLFPPPLAILPPTRCLFRKLPPFVQLHT